MQMSAVLAAMPEQDRLLSQVQLQCAWNYLNLFDKPEEAGIMFQESLKACTLQVPIAAVHVLIMLMIIMLLLIMIMMMTLITIIECDL